MYIHTTANPSRSFETIFTIFCLLCGLLNVGTIIAAMSSLLYSLDSLADAKKNQIETIGRFLTLRRVDKKLRRQIQAYYEYIWDSGLSEAQKNIFRGLPGSLQLRLQIQLKKQLVNAVPFFRSISPASVAAIMSKLRTVVAIPEEIITVAGEQGDRCAKCPQNHLPA